MDNMVNRKSGYWLGTDMDDRWYDPLTGEYNKPNGKDIFALAGYQRAIANFVTILCNEHVPVQFNTKDDSYTDGETIVLSGNIDDGNFDVAVGLALHEGSHIKLTDFSLLKRNFVTQELIDLAHEKGIKPGYLKGIVKDLLNVVEDRRIDYYVQTTAPGYKGYYAALYDKYFNSNIIDRALKEEEWNEVTVEHYMNHIINFINANRTLDLLPGLRDIWNVLDLRNIKRLKTTEDALVVALRMAELILTQLPEPEEGEGEGDEGKEGKESNGQGGTGGGGGNNDDTDNNDTAGNDDGETAEGEDSEDTGENNNTGNNTNGNKRPSKLTDRQLQQLAKQLAKQKEFLDGNIKKTNISKKDKNSIDAAVEADAMEVEVGYTSESKWSGTANHKAKVRVIRNYNEKLLDSGITNMASKYSWASGQQQQAVNDGIRLGTMLAKKLIARNDDRTTQYNRQRKGRIDGRMLAELGMGNYKIFEQTFTQTANKGHIHISIDASGSMSGDKFRNSIKMAVAIAKAADVVGGIRVVIDTRSTEGSNDQPIVLIAYDSKRDKINKIVRLFQYLQCPGVTPEGLCFAAIQNLIEESNNGLDSYFINLSDGQPYCGSYNGHAALVHTRNEVNKMRAKGVEVLGYWIESYRGGKTEPNASFKTMYGKDAKLVDSDSVMEIARTMNELLGRKS